LIKNNIIYFICFWIICGIIKFITTIYNGIIFFCSCNTIFFEFWSITVFCSYSGLWNNSTNTNGFSWIIYCCTINSNISIKGKVFKGYIVIWTIRNACKYILILSISLLRYCIEIFWCIICAVNNLYCGWFYIICFSSNKMNFTVCCVYNFIYNSWCIVENLNCIII